MKLEQFTVTMVDNNLVKISAKGWNMGIQVEHYALRVTDRFTGGLMGYEFFGIKGLFEISEGGYFIGSDHPNPSGVFNALGWDS